MLSARGILAVLSAVFLVLALTRIAEGGRASNPATRTWLIIGVIFGVVSAWLWLRAAVKWMFVACTSRYFQVVTSKSLR